MANNRTLLITIASENRASKGFKDAQRDVGSFQKRIGQAGTETSRFGSRVETLQVGISKMAIGLGAAAVAGRGLVSWMGSARESANNLTESVNAVQVVFGDAADKVLEFGENAAETVGLANSEFNQLVTPIGSLLRNFGFDADEAADAAVTLTQRASDMASVFNTDVSQALGAIQAALRGETDPIERFGASVNAAAVEAFLLEEGLVDSKDAITDADKVMGRYKLLLEQTATVQGDFARTSDENANATRIFEASLEDLRAKAGEALIPVFDELVEAGNDLLPALETLGTEVLPLVTEAAADFVAGVAAIAEFIGALPDGVKVASGALLGLVGTARLLYTNPVIAGLGLVAAGIIAIGDAARDEKVEVDELKVAIEELLNTGDEDPLFEAVKQDIRDIIRDSDELFEAFQNLGVPLDDLADFVLGDPVAAERVAEAAERVNQASQGPGRLDPAVIGDVRGVNELIDALDSQRNRLSETTDETIRLRDAERELKDEGELADKITQQQATAQYDLNDARSSGSRLSEESAEAMAEEKARTDELAGGIRQLAQAYAEDLNEAAIEYLDIFEKEAKVDPVVGVEQLLANAEARVETISGFLSGLTRLRDEGLFDLALQFQSEGVSTQNVAELEAVIADIDRGGSTAFELDETLAAAESEIGRITAAMGLQLAAEQQPLLEDAQRLGVEMGEAIAQGLERVALNFSLRVATGGMVGGSGGSRGNTGRGGVRALASGGSVGADEMVLVGENGPELFRPSRAGVVYPNSSLTGAGMNVNVAVHNPQTRNLDQDIQRGLLLSGISRWAEVN